MHNDKSDSLPNSGPYRIPIETTRTVIETSYVNGKMVKLEADEWKDILTAAFKGESVRLAMGLDGGVVMLGQRTSVFGKAKFSDWLEFLHATAADRGVNIERTTT